MYREYFGLKEAPFSIAPDPHYFFISEGHREALAHLMYGVNSDSGFVLLTGEVGAGKTTVCRCLLKQIPSNCEVALILNPKVSSLELLASICDEFRIPYPKGHETIKDLVARINEFLIQTSEQGKKAILIIEEAQNLSVEVLEQVRLLTNLETDQRKLLQIIMVGQPELREILAKPELRQLSQRITARYHLGPLRSSEIAAYVDYRLSKAGLLRGQLFPVSLMRTLYDLTGGLPRLINVICDRALLGAYTQGKDSVDKTTLLTAASEVSGKLIRGRSNHSVYLWSLAAFLIVLFLLGSWYYLHRAKMSPRTGPVVASAGPMPSSSTTQADTLNALASREVAYLALFSAWGLAFNPKDSLTPCEQALVQGLRCQEGKADEETIRRMNKPILLRLVDSEGKDHYITVTALHGEEATYSSGGTSKTGLMKDITKAWRGDYVLLWRLPREYDDALKPGGSGPFVSWLDRQLALIEGRKQPARTKQVYDREMVQRVKVFQTASGLKADGIVGPTTVGHIILRNGTEGPVLDGRGVR